MRRVSRRSAKTRVMNAGPAGVVLMLLGAACGATSPQEPQEVPANDVGAAYEERAEDPWLEPAVADPPNDPDTQPVQPEEVPTPIDGVLGNQWQCAGEVEASRLQAQLDAAAADFRSCFVETMINEQIKQIDIRLLARVDKRGRVTDHVVRSTPPLEEPIACAANVLRGLKLVKPRGGDCMVIDYPLRFSISY